VKDCARLTESLWRESSRTVFRLASVELTLVNAIPAGMSLNQNEIPPVERRGNDIAWLQAITASRSVAGKFEFRAWQANGSRSVS
jgi:hypothetical protein